ncbi:MAG TPA: hypothetical protein VFJ86_12845, partial [Usitatibacter sp.]|nr:hypothetical protein [Usitatibacter sp.]
GALRIMGGAAQTAATAMQGTPAQSNAVNSAQDAVQNPGSAVDQLRSKLENAQANGTIQEKAAEAKPAATKTAWGTFIALILTLIASVLGAAVGRRRHPAAID